MRQYNTDFWKWVEETTKKTEEREMAEAVEFASAIHKRYNFCPEHRPVALPRSNCAQCEIDKLWDLLDALQNTNAQLKLELVKAEGDKSELHSIISTMEIDVEDAHWELERLEDKLDAYTIEE